jgi:hypothetical protein
MSESDGQLRALCAWNNRLTRDMALLGLQLRSKELEISALKMANADLLVERDAINTALGAAMDAALEGKR